MAGEKALNTANGKRVATKDFDYMDKNGDIKTKQKGDEFNLKEIPQEERDLAKLNSRVQDTRVTKMVKGGAKGIWDGAGNLKDKLFDKIKPTSFSTEQETPNSSNSEHNPKQDSEIKNQPFHDNSFSNNMNNSTTKQDLMQQISEKQDNLEKDWDKGKIDINDYVKDYMKHDNLKEKVNANHINVGDLKRNGIDTSHLATDDKGFVDFAKSDESALKAEKSKICI